MEELVFQFRAPQMGLVSPDSSPRHTGDRERLSSFSMCVICPCICCKPRSAGEERSCTPRQQVLGGEEMEEGRN